MGKKTFQAIDALRCVAAALLLMVAMAKPVLAASTDLPRASESMLSGISFSDKPIYLPVQQSFQTAMIAAGGELGRSCGKLESFGWRMKQSEQDRVNQVFNAAVDQFRKLGYEVVMQNPSGVSNDITIFTADRSDKQFMTMWSAGDVGLVMVLCETSPAPKVHATNKVSSLAMPMDSDDVIGIRKGTKSKATKASDVKFSPAGKWTGSYVCGQGYTGATITIDTLKGDNFRGSFHFYPTSKNPDMPEGQYAIFGQYDRGSQRILINPGDWVKRPKNYQNTVIVGKFDPGAKTFSAFFQGITGCTSFEARYDKDGAIGRKAEVSARVASYVDVNAKKKSVAAKTPKKLPKKKVSEKIISNEALPDNAYSLSKPAVKKAPEKKAAAKKPAATTKGTSPNRDEPKFNTVKPANPANPVNAVNPDSGIRLDDAHVKALDTNKVNLADKPEAAPKPAVGPLVPAPTPVVPQKPAAETSKLPPLVVPEGAKLAVPIDNAVTVPAGSKLTVPSGKAISVPTGGKLSVPIGTSLAVPAGSKLVVPTPDSSPPSPPIVGVTPPAPIDPLAPGSDTKLALPPSNQ